MGDDTNELHADYKGRLNRVFEYIDAHPDGDLSLNALSGIACFSPFHFHRIFKTVTGETLNAYVTRRRIELAALALLHTGHELSGIFAKYGFSDASSFSRAFKKFYGVSPTEFRKLNPHKFSKIRQLESKIGQAYPDREKYLCAIENINKWTMMNAKIEVKEMPALQLAYVSCIGPQNLAVAFQTLVRWGRSNGLMNDATRMLVIYQDSLKVTAEKQARMQACMTLGKPAKIEGEIGQTTIKKGNYIVGSYEISLDEFEKAWTGLFVWMNDNGYKKAAGQPFEMYHNNFNEHPEKKAIVDFFIPVV